MEMKMRREEIEEVLEKANVPYSIEVVIRDEETGKVIFRWRRGRGNLVQGVRKTIEVIEQKVGIPIE